MKAKIDELLENPLHQSLDSASLSDLRRVRDACQIAESDVSLVRRLTQGRLDIVGHEVKNRAGDSTERVDVSAILYELPDILAEGSSGSRGRIDLIDPGEIAAGLINDLDSLVNPSELSGLKDQDSAGVQTIFGSLQDFEGDLSNTRKALHNKIDAIQQEIGARYRDGEATTQDAIDR